MKRPGLTTIVCSKTWNKSQRGAQSNKVYPFSENHLIKGGTMIILAPNRWCLKVFTRVVSSTSSPISSTNAFPFYPRWIKHEKRKAWKMLDSPNKWFTFLKDTGVYHAWTVESSYPPIQPYLRHGTKHIGQFLRIAILNVCGQADNI